MPSSTSVAAAVITSPGRAQVAGVGHRRVDQQRRLHEIVFSQYSGPVRILIENRFVFDPFWRALRDHDAEFYVERPAPLALGQVQALPVPKGMETGKPAREAKEVKEAGAAE